MGNKYDNIRQSYRWRNVLNKMGVKFLSRLKIKYAIASVLLITTLQYFGAFTHIFEVDFYTSFNYPLEGDIQKYVLQLRNMEVPDVAPINTYNYTFISSCDKKCRETDHSGKLRLVYIVKSAVKHFDRRIAIRNSWGFEKRFSDVPIRTVFLLGIDPENIDLQADVEKEQQKYGDIIQAGFIDSYFNNTIKTVMGFKWAVTFCPNSKFYMFSDDDMYVSTKNALRFIRNPTQYPEYLETPVIALKRMKRVQYSQEIISVKIAPSNSSGERKLQQFLDFELPDDARLFSGYVFVSAPHRHRSSKWHVSLAEYPYHMWPPYVTAGAYVLSREALFDMYYTSMYTKHFRFDDIFLGIVAKKANIEPFHCTQFHYYKKEYNIFSYRHVVASHGYDDPNELLKVWNEQRSAGNA
ncbi:beta-1,3-galactosyltransferase brn isoform X1 [Periplaneta americana]|uniref:beta-1,3-galactosyltransferase brn isoform X1 n=2 Tax=Periplaneta americana TaxID=6978 RepID=UPI0037E7C73A